MDRLTKRSIFCSCGPSFPAANIFRKVRIEMKRILTLLLALAMVLSLAACGSTPAETPADTAAEEPTAAPASGSYVLAHS